MTPQLVGLPGDHGFHAHVNPNCGPTSPTHSENSPLILFIFLQGVGALPIR